MSDDVAIIDLSPDDLRAVAGYAAACAGEALAIFEHARPGDVRPRAAVEAALAFAGGAARSKALRGAAWAAQAAAREAVDGAASQAARAALAAAGAGFLHPLAKATQVKHILGAGAHAARAVELATRNDAAAGEAQVARMRDLAPPRVVQVLRRYPPAPAGGGRVGELMRRLDAALRLT